MLSWWTIGRATGIGVTAGLLALILWPTYAAFQELALWPFVAALAVAAFCGVSILLISIADAVLRRRSPTVRPIRAFDMALGALLAGPSLIELGVLLG
jgi:hypothetical protein